MTNLKSICLQSIDRRLANWAFLDIGFAGSNTKSSGLLLPGEGIATDRTWADACTHLVRLVANRSEPLNLMVEAPLSMAFDPNGNPARRTFEARDTQKRFWYLQGGAVVLLATSILLQRLHRSARCPLQLFEAFLSFKTERSSHSADAELMRRAIADPVAMASRLEHFEGDQIKCEPAHRLMSSTFESGLDFGIPPVFDFLPAPPLSPSQGRHQ